MSTEGSDSDLSSSRQYYGLKGLERAAILAEVQREIDERRRKSPPTTPNRADKTHISPEDSQRASQRHFKIAATLSGAALLSTIALTALSLISGAWPIIITAVITLALASASKEASKKANTGVQIKTNANPYYISNGWHKSQATHLKKDIRNNLILLGLCIGGYIVGGLAAIGLIATGLMVPMLVVSAATTLLVGGNIIKSAIDLRAHNKVIDN